MFKALIVDDDKADRDLLKYMLQKHPDITDIHEADSAESALFKLIEIRPNLVLLDLVMPGKSGMEFISLIRKEKIDTNIIIISSHKNMAIEAIKNEVYDFLLKPLNHEKLNAALSTIKTKQLSSTSVEAELPTQALQQAPKLRISTTSSYSIVDPKDILYCEAEGSYTNIYLDNGDIELANSYLKKIEEILVNHNFFRIGRSYLINLNKLRSVNRHESSCLLVAQKKEVKLYGSKRQIRELCRIENITE